MTQLTLLFHYTSQVDAILVYHWKSPEDSWVVFLTDGNCHFQSCSSQNTGAIKMRQ